MISICTIAPLRENNKIRTFNKLLKEFSHMDFASRKEKRAPLPLSRIGALKLPYLRIAPMWNISTLHCGDRRRRKDEGVMSKIVVINTPFSETSLWNKGSKYSIGDAREDYSKRTDRRKISHHVLLTPQQVLSTFIFLLHTTFMSTSTSNNH